MRANRAKVCMLLIPAAWTLHPTSNLVPTCSSRRLQLRASSVDSTTATNPRTEGLALALDDGTRKVHSVAENTQFVTGFFKGIASVATFAQLTAALFFIYEAMEGALDETKSDNVRALDFPELRRLQSLERDMQHFFGDDWRANVKPSRATLAYVDRIKRVATEDLLIGHLYSRYLGDLFGGQMMSSMASKSLGLQSDGLAFYSFDDIRDTRSFIDRWYTSLNDLDLPRELQQEIVDEANIVFRLNIDIFNELEGGNPLKAALIVAFKSFADRLFGH